MCNKQHHLALIPGLASEMEWKWQYGWMITLVCFSLDDQYNLENDRLSPLSVLILWFSHFLSNNEMYSYTDIVFVKAVCALALVML